jgi:CRISPR-associated protein Cas2
MFVIAVYDISGRKVAKVLKASRKYLSWVQNSVFEGEITNATFEAMKVELGKIIDKEEDSVVFYTFREKAYTGREIMGLEKGGVQTIL